MKHITILVPNGNNNLSSIVGTYKILTRANNYWKQKHRRTIYSIEMAGVSKEVDFHGGLFSVKPHTHINNIPRTDLVIIPSLSHNYEQTITENKAIAVWIEHQYKCGAELASICTGAFLLASLGLLDHKSCSTHWAFADSFREMFPKVNLQTDKLITDENGIYTNGGAFSFLNLVLYLVEKYFDRDTAIFCSKVFQIEPDRDSQSPFIIFTGQKKHNDDIIKEAQVYIENNLQEKISIDSLSSLFAIGRRNFDRRFIKATGNSPSAYAQRVRVEAAKKLLETSRKNIHEVMYEVGYTDVKAFRDVFKKVTGISPLAYRNKYNKLVFS
jgi:transcriptional regulator GlxA family with amidase domain